MPVIKSVIKKEGKNGAFWVCVIDGEEVLAFDSKAMEYEGKECPFPIAGGQDGKKKYIQFPKAGGFQKGGAGGGWKGKSKEEIYLSALTMSMAYAKDIVVADIEKGITVGIKELIDFYKEISKAILSDLKILCPEVPVQTEAPKTETKAHEKPPQETSRPHAGTDTGTMTVKEKLKKEMWQYLVNKRADTEEHFKALLIELTEFEGKNRDTGELTGKMVYVDDMADKKFSDKWAQTAVGNLRKLVEQEERKSANDMQDDVPY